MIAVSDTSPLRYLSVIGEAGLLPRMFGCVLCPATVRNEGCHERAPTALRELLSQPPPWLMIEEDVPLLEMTGLVLDPGELAAIALAKARLADVLLMDERRGRRAAETAGLRVAGTINLIAETAVRGWLDFYAVVSKLRSETKFCISEDVVAEAWRQTAG